MSRNSSGGRPKTTAERVAAYRKRLAERLELIEAENAALRAGNEQRAEIYRLLLRIDDRLDQALDRRGGQGATPADRIAELEAENAELRERLDVATEALALLRRSRAFKSSV